MYSLQEHAPPTIETDDYMLPVKRFLANQVQILVVDLQERLVPGIDGKERVLANTIRILKIANLLEIPTLGTVQYPKGLGQTIEPIASLLTSEPVPKMTFSAIGPDPVREWINPDFATILVGIETHVCLAQTALDLLEMGVTVLMPVDAVSARNRLDHDTAMHRLTQAGVIPTTTEALLFEWIATAEHAHFKAVSKIVKEFDKGL